MGTVFLESNWLFVTDWRTPSAVHICASTTAVSNMCLWCETLKKHSWWDGSKSSLPWERRHYDVWQHVSSVEKYDHYAFAWVFFTTQLTHDLLLLLRCHANMWRLWRDLILSGCLALISLYNLKPYGQFRDQRDFFLQFWSLLWSLLCLV